MNQSQFVEFNIGQGLNYKKYIGKSKKADRVYRNVNLFPDVDSIEDHGGAHLSGRLSPLSSTFHTS